MSMADIVAAGQRLTEAADAYHGKIADIDARVNEKRNEVEAFLLNAREKMAAPLSMEFDVTIINSKASLNLATDPTGAHRTVWARIAGFDSGSHFYGSEANYFAALMLGRAVAIPPGHYESPDRYATDRSVTEIEFVIAPIGSEAHINAHLNANAIVPTKAGAWAFSPASHIVPILSIPGQDSAKDLFVRFVNRALVDAPEVPDDTVPQSVATFGGNTNFTISRLNFHQK